MTCGEITRHLSAHVDGELSGAGQREVDRHLASCEPCRRRRAVLAAVRAAVQRVPREAVSAGFAAAFESRLARVRRGSRPAGWRAAALVAGLAAAAVLVALGLLSRREAGAPQGQPQRAATVALTEVPFGWDCGRPSAVSRCQVVVPCAGDETCGLVALGALARVPSTNRPHVRHEPPTPG
jgi:anti-sigma factor RsiW